MKKKVIIFALLLAMLLIGTYSTNNVEAGFEEVDYEEVDRY